MPKEEAAVRERGAEELRLAEGAFPARSSSGSGGGCAAIGVRGGGGREEGREVVVDSDILCFW